MPDAGVVEKQPVGAGVAVLERPTPENSATKPRETRFKPSGDMRMDVESFCLTLDPVRLREVLKRMNEAGSAQNPHVSFAEAQALSTTYNRIRDGQEVVESDTDRDLFRRLLKRSGVFDDEKIGKISDTEAMAIGQIIFHYSVVDDPADDDFKYAAGSDQRRVEEALKREEVMRAKDLDDGEFLTLEKIEKYSSAYKGKGDWEPKTGGPGASGTKTVDEEIDEVDLSTIDDKFKRFVREIKLAKLRPFEVQRIKFPDIESAIDNAVLDGTLEASDPKVSEVRDILSRKVDSLLKLETRSNRETPMAEHLLTVTTGLKALIKDMLKQDRASGEWADRASELKRFADMAEEATKRVEAVKIDHVNPDDMFVDVPFRNADGSTETQKMASARYVFEVAKAINDVYRLQDAGGRQKIVEALGGVDFANKFISWNDEHTHLYRRIHNRYTQIYENDSTENQKAKVGDLVIKGNHYLSAMLSDWRDLNEASTDILGSVKDKDDPIGLRQWKASRYYYTLERALEEHQIFRSPGDPDDVPKNIARIFSFMEDLDLGPEELRPMIQSAKSMLQVLPTETKEDRERRSALADRIDASALMLSVYMTLEEKDMHPAAVDGVLNGFEGRKETTVEYYVERFGEDTRGRPFYVKEVGKDGKTRYVRLNTYDVSLQDIYSKDVNDDRIRMNMIEELTRLSIDTDGNYSASLMSRIKAREGFGDLEDEWRQSVTVDGRTYRDKWEYEFYKLRDYFRKRTAMLIADNTKPGGKWAGKSLGVDDVWARLGGVKRGLVDERREFILETRELIDEWHKKRTIHGAFGTLKQDDIDAMISNDHALRLKGDLADFLGRLGKDEGEIRKFLETRVGKSYLDVWREVEQLRLIQKLKAMDLKVYRGTYHPSMEDVVEEDSDEYRKFFEHLKDADFDELEEVGFFGSVDYNAFNWTWMMQWSAQEYIRIYSKDTKSKFDDDFDGVVFHHSTNLFHGRARDDLWAHFNQDVENRGRAKQDEVNTIFKQAFPGKHHYYTPQISFMVRWADRFMTPDQKRVFEQRIRQMMKDYDIDTKAYHEEAVSWVKSVVIMDMIKNGALYFSSKGAKFSQVAKDKEMTKFGFIDYFSDAKKGLEAEGPETIQDYLSNPTESKLVSMISRVKGFAYSTRFARDHILAVLAFRGHWGFASKYRRDLFDRPNLTAAGGEQVIQDMIQQGDMERKQGEKEKTKFFGFAKIGGKVPFTDKELSLTLGEFFGTVPFRYIRRFGEKWRRIAWDIKGTLVADAPLSAFWEAVKEFFKQLPRQSLPGTR